MYQPLTSISACTRCDILSISRSNTSPLIDHHTSCNRSLRTWRIYWGEPRRVAISGYRWWSSSLRWAHRFSIKFISGEWGGHSMTANLRSLAVVVKNAWVFFDVWTEELSCWKVISVMLSAANASRYGRRLFRNMVIYTSLFTEPSIDTIGPSLLLTKHPHIICERSPSFDFPQIFLGAYFSSLIWCRNTQTCWRAESFCIAHSSDHATLAQSSRVQWWCASAHWRRFSACSYFKRARLTARHFRIKSSCSRRRMVDVEAGTLTMFCNEVKGTRVLVSATEMICLSYAFIVIWGWPGRERFFDECRILRRVRKLDTVC